jgi:hypothetical protein
LSETKGARGAVAAEQKQTQVFFTDDISVNGLQKIYSRINQGMTGRIGIKLHTGEPHGPNLLPIELIKSLQPQIPNSNIVECNVLYPSPRQNTKGHLETIKTNGFDFCPVDIMDAEGHLTLPIPGMQEFLDEWMSPALKQRPFTPGAHLTEIAVGKNLLNYDSLLAYTHFKGHTSGGFGGSLKNIAIGCSSGKLGKRQIHGEGWPKGPLFLERMVEAGKGITRISGRGSRTSMFSRTSPSTATATGTAGSPPAGTSASSARRISWPWTRLRSTWYTRCRIRNGATSSSASRAGAACTSWNT